jgi:hypothetical protein
MWLKRASLEGSSWLSTGIVFGSTAAVAVMFLQGVLRAIKNPRLQE